MKRILHKHGSISSFVRTVLFSVHVGPHSTAELEPVLQAKKPLGSMIDRDAAVLQAQLLLGQSCDARSSAAALQSGLPPPQAAASTNANADKQGRHQAQHMPRASHSSSRSSLACSRQALPAW